MATTTVRVSGDLGAWRSRLHSKLGAICREVAFGLTAIEAASPSSTHVPGAWFQTGVELQAAPKYPEIRDATKRRLLQGGLRDCVEALALMLEDVREIVELSCMTQKGTLTEAEYRRIAPKQREAFHELPIRDKLKKLQNLGLSFPPLFEPFLLSLNALRTCLVHRLGIVGPKDCRKGPMVVRWLRLQILVHTDSGRVPVTPPFLPEPGQKIDLDQEDTSRSFQVGDTVNITAQEFTEMAFTFFMLGEDVIHATEAALTAHGVRFKPAGPLRMTHLIGEEV
jgi:hypothetical protein